MGKTDHAIKARIRNAADKRTAKTLALRAERQQCYNENHAFRGEEVMQHSGKQDAIANFLQMAMG